MTSPISFPQANSDVNPLRRGRALIIDTETTGLGYAHIIELGAVEIVDGECTGLQFHSYIRSDVSSTPEALKVHGLSTDFLRSHPPPNQVFRRFLDFIGTSSLVGHNVAFDARMLCLEIARLRKEEEQQAKERAKEEETPAEWPAELTNPLYCTRLAYKRRFSWKSARLANACAFFKIDHKTARRCGHGALIDAKLCTALLLCLLRLPQIPLDLSHHKLRGVWRPAVPLLGEPPRTKQTPKEEEEETQGLEWGMEQVSLKDAPTISHKQRGRPLGRVSPIEEELRFRALDYFQTASAKQLQWVPYINASKAAIIVALRPFASYQDLVRKLRATSGVSPAVIEVWIEAGREIE